jgi:hypothetical protein
MFIDFYGAKGFRKTGSRSLLAHGVAEHFKERATETYQRIFVLATQINERELAAIPSSCPMATGNVEVIKQRPARVTSLLSRRHQMLIRSYRLIFAFLIACTLFIINGWSPAAQSISKSGHPNSSANASRASRSRSEAEASLQVLARLRAFRDCWSDPYMIIAADDSRSENDSLYLRCGDQYSLRLAELKDVAEHSMSSVNDPALRRQISESMEIFNALDNLHRLFNSRTYFMTRDIRVSDIFPIVRKYNIRYKENRISKVTIYQAMMPLRRTHIDELAKLVSSAPPDTNPTLTQSQAADAADELDWSFVTRHGRGYDWYLRRHPQGRHAPEARHLVRQQ